MAEIESFLRVRVYGFRGLSLRLISPALDSIGCEGILEMRPAGRSSGCCSYATEANKKTVFYAQAKRPGRKKH